MKAAIFFGSNSDKETMRKTAEVLKDFGVEYKAWTLSAHRCPERLAQTVKRAEADGAEIIIAGAGLAAHLPGVIAAQTVLPVIGVPIASGSLGGLDALASIVQMPRPVPVASVGINNAANAGYLACRILAIKYPELQKKLERFYERVKEECAEQEEADL